MAGKSITTNLTIPRSLKEKIDCYGENHGLSMAAVIRMAIAKFVKETEDNAEQKEAA